MRIFTREIYNRLEDNENELYNTHFIRKGNGRGVRRIDEPAQELKQMQRFALRVLNHHARLLTHWRACGCIPGLDVRQRVMQHANWQWVITTDIKDFYPTVTFDMLSNVRRLRTYMDAEDIRCCLRTVENQQVLPQGAPTSPMLANIAVIDLDNAIENMLQEWLGTKNNAVGVGYMAWEVPTIGNGVHPADEPYYRALYSRYMDDIILSVDCPTREEVLELKQMLLELIERHGFIPNIRKTKVKPYYQRQKWIGFSLNGRDTIRNQPHVDKRYVNKVIDEGIDIVLRQENPFDDVSWNGKLEYIRFNNIKRYHRVLRKVALEMHVLEVEIPDYVRLDNEVERCLRAHDRRVTGEEEQPWFDFGDIPRNSLSGHSHMYTWSTAGSDASGAYRVGYNTDDA